MNNTIRYGNLLLKLSPETEVFSRVEKDEIITLFDKDGRQVTPDYVEVGLGYEKGNGKHKVTSRVRSNSELISTNLNVLLSRYDLLYAIDTNKKRIDGIDYCVSCRMAIHMERRGPQQWFLTNTRLPSFIFTNPTVHEELIGWSQFIEQENMCSNPKSIGIVTDHNFGYMPSYNLREKKILDDQYLPSNVELLYASAERDLTSPLNKAIKQCDADSNFLLKQIVSRKMNMAGLADSDSLYFDNSGHLSPKNKSN
ncbi:hypothetical protein MED121_24030 [Marinomonas sp. MED121]|uniref:hypothetical protein n=1 Tax=Marinomonas sp. MED121 TaxID=314277 RepID=UPI000069016B|nr:hypothetical protein [Marinomonas sp. MED121]EAQ63079.1 hypothetical protein MED121_24030 [Marinomonas sp. MED121]